MPQYSGMWTLSQVSQAVKNQTWTGLPPSVVEYLIVAGGGSGGGGASGYSNSAGGGAGGLLAGHTGITPGTSYFVTVGAGGAGVLSDVGGSGGNSVFKATTSAATSGHIVALGGGGGGGGTTNASNLGVAGGSGGGGAGAGSATYTGDGASGTAGQGNAGGRGLSAADQPGGGGGGAGTVGLAGAVQPGSGGKGGAGVASVISGALVTYAGGGGGGINPGSGGTGGIGGGGTGTSTSSGGAGTVNLGGGGGGAVGGGSTGGAGGSGVVIIRYPGTTQFFTGGTLSYANGYVSHTFYANGVLAPTTPTLYTNPDYQIARSLRFNSADSPHLSRTPASTSSQTTATFSAWIKRSQLGTFGDCRIFTESTGSGTGLFWIQMVSDKVGVYINGSADGITSTQVFRDPSAWYHLVVAVDTTQATSTDRIKMYVNNVQITAFTGTQTYYTQGQLLKFNVTTSTNHIGYVNSQTFDGYMADINWIDGQALTPSSFGWTNPATGVWAPLDFVGTYGTNGFNLNFSDNTNTTAATLGADSSGNGNNFTPNNFSVSAGAGNDSLVDTPTLYGTDTGVGGEVRGNYCTVNAVTKTTNMTLTNGNLDCVSSDSDWSQALGTIGMSSGKWYFEVTKVNAGGGALIGIAGSSVVYSASAYIYQSPVGYLYYQTGQKYSNNVDSAYGASYTAGDVVGVAFDADAGTLVFYKNGASQGTAFSGLTSGPYLPAILPNNTTGNLTCNFGQRPFAYTAPSGFKALCTQNLPTPTIGATSTTLANKFFGVNTWAGTGATQVIGNAGFQPDFVWIKSRSASANHYLGDSVRGLTKYMCSNATDAEFTLTDQITSLNASGFTLGIDTNSGTNYSGRTYVGWQWRASNASAVTNTSGSITSSVSASPTSGFSVVTYTNASSGTVGHGLGVAPAMVIYKDRTNVTNWIVLHQSLTNMSSSFLVLNLTNAVATLGTALGGSPTSSVIYTNTDIIQNGAASVAYCFAAVAGYSAFGSYTGNGSNAGGFVHTGFRPAFVMIKRAVGGSGSWYMEDSTRDTYNPTGLDIEANANAAEAPDTPIFDFLSNGFKLRNNYTGFNTNGDTYIYMSFAENPFKYGLAR